MKRRVLAQIFENENSADGKFAKLNADMSKYYHIIKEEETKTLFKNLDAVYKRVFLLELHNKKLRKQIAKRHSVLKSRT